MTSKLCALPPRLHSSQSLSQWHGHHSWCFFNHGLSTVALARARLGQIRPCSIEHAQSCGYRFPFGQQDFNGYLHHTAAERRRFQVPMKSPTAVATCSLTTPRAGLDSEVSRIVPRLRFVLEVVWSVVHQHQGTAVERIPKTGGPSLRGTREHTFDKVSL